MTDLTTWKATYFLSSGLQTLLSGLHTQIIQKIKNTSVLEAHHFQPRQVLIAPFRCKESQTQDKRSPESASLDDGLSREIIVTLGDNMSVLFWNEHTTADV